jgi:hypothetical protein
VDGCYTLRCKAEIQRGRESLISKTPDPFEFPARPRRRWFTGQTSTARRAAADRAFEAKIDRILDKVREQGMQSLGRSEQRLLKKATRLQRRQSGD